MDRLSQFKMCTWNSRSLQSNLSEFKLQLYSEKPHIACVCETWMQQNREPRFINYRAIWKHRVEGRGGGLLCLVRNDVAIVPNDLELFPNGNLEAQWVTIMTNRGKLKILNTYNPCKHISKEEYCFYVDQLTGNSVFVGDLNSHHQIWDGRTENDRNGNNLCETLLEHPTIALLTPQSFPTYVNSRTGFPSTLDLCFISSHLYPLSSISIGGDCGSDHALLIIEIHINPNTIIFKTRERWNFDSGCFVKWRKALPPIEEKNNVDLQNRYNKFCQNIEGACSETFKTNKTTVLAKYSKPWWSKACSEALKQKRKAKNLLKKHPTMENLIEVKKSTAILKKITKEQKRKSWEEYCNKINCSTSVSNIWKQVGKLKNTYKRENTPLITPAGILTSASEKSEEYARKFAEAVNSPIPEVNPMPLLLPISWALCDTGNSQYNKPFTEVELRGVISKLKDSSAGRDKIHNKIIKNLPENYRDELLSIFNQSYMNHICPVQKKQ